MSDDFKSMPRIKAPPLADMSISREDFFESSKFDNTLEMIAEEKEEAEKRETEYRESVVKALQGIEKNTALLTEMTVLMQKNNDKQEQIFELITEILSIMKSKDKEEAESKFTAVMKKIAAVSDGVNGVSSLFTMAQTVYTAAQAMF